MMDFKIRKYSPKFKEELPPINRQTRSVNNQINKNQKELCKSEVLNKIDPLVLVAQYEREINRMKINHSHMLEDLHKELEILRLKNRDLLDELILMNGGNYCCKHLKDLSNDILKSNASDNQKQLCDILEDAKIHQVSTNDCKNYNHKKELPKLIAVGNNCVSKDSETKSNLLLQDQLNKCNKLIDMLQLENLQQKSELSSLKTILSHGLKISGIGLDSGSIRKNLKSNTRILSSLSHSAISYLDVDSSEKCLHSVSGSK